MVALKYTDLTLSPDYELIEELIVSSQIPESRLSNLSYNNRGPSGTPHYATTPTFFLTILALLRTKDFGPDIRADNILIDEEGEVRLSGLRQLVSLAQNGEYIKSVFSLVGDNTEWAAPEVMAQNSNFNEKVDIYSFGITALELAFNRTPFDKWPAMKILLNKLEYDCPAIPSDKVLSPPFFNLVKICTQKDPAAR
ncbi:hypothetical protein HDU97_000906 [Phlyctochytrium planicorne]|nr:hypothetical protein HDU97_000906 [Phlyctochytrium planicorne]